MLRVVMSNVAVLSIIILRAVVPIITIPSEILSTLIMLGAVMLSVILMNVVKMFRCRKKCLVVICTWTTVISTRTNSPTTGASEPSKWARSFPSAVQFVPSDFGPASAQARPTMREWLNRWKPSKVEYGGSFSWNDWTVIAKILFFFERPSWVMTISHLFI